MCLSPFLTSFILNGRGASTHPVEEFDLPPPVHLLCSAVLQASGRDAEHQARGAGENHANTHQRPDHPQ